MSAIFTAAMLEEAKACQPQIGLFRALFGESVVVTVARARKVSDQFEWGYAERFLDALGRAEYDCARAPAWAEYRRVRTPAWAEYRRVLAPALAEYKRVQALAWASAYIATRKRANAVSAPYL